MINSFSQDDLNGPVDADPNDLNTIDHVVPQDIISIDAQVASDEWDKLPNWTTLCQALINETAIRVLVDYEDAEDIQLSLVLADDDFVQNLNKKYRGKNQPTNVLSFPQEPDVEEDGIVLLGDIVMSWQTLRKEATKQSKNMEDHFAHLLVHGFLHLLGFDHQDEKSALQMESLEIEILHHFNIANPYEIKDNDKVKTSKG